MHIGASGAGQVAKAWLLPRGTNCVKTFSRAIGSSPFEGGAV